MSKFPMSYNNGSDSFILPKSGYGILLLRHDFDNDCPILCTTDSDPLSPYNLSTTKSEALQQLKSLREQFPKCMYVLIDFSCLED